MLFSSKEGMNDSLSSIKKNIAYNFHMNKKAKAPDFSGLFEENKMVSLDDFCGKYLVIYFYPKDKTSGCTVESQDFRDLKIISKS